MSSAGTPRGKNGAPARKHLIQPLEEYPARVPVLSVPRPAWFAYFPAFFGLLGLGMVLLIQHDVSEKEALLAFGQIGIGAAIMALVIVEIGYAMVAAYIILINEVWEMLGVGYELYRRAVNRSRRRRMRKWALDDAADAALEAYEGAQGEGEEEVAAAVAAVLVEKFRTNHDLFHPEEGAPHR